MPTFYKDLIPNKKLRDKMRHRVHNAIKRCYDNKCPSYCRYGGKGIKVHPNWLVNRRQFIIYLMTLEGWDNLNLELDRIKANKDYEPGNLRFVNRIQQDRNKDYRLKINYRIMIYSLPDFYDRYVKDIFDYSYRHVQNLKRYYPNATGEWIIDRLFTKEIKRSNKYRNNRRLF